MKSFRTFLFACSAVLLVLQLGSAARAEGSADALAPGSEQMLDGHQIINLLPDVIAFSKTASGLKPSKQRILWTRTVENRYRDYFERAVYRGADADTRREMLDSFLAQLPDRIPAIQKFSTQAGELIVDSMIDFKARFPNYIQQRDIYVGVSFFGFDGTIKPVSNELGVPDTLCIGSEVAAGYSTDQLKIALVHELFHLYHFNYLFAGVYKSYGLGMVYDQEVMNRLVAAYIPLMVEGMAVAASEQIYPGRPLTMYLHFSSEQLSSEQDEIVQSAQDFLSMIKMGALPYQYDRWFNGAYDGIPKRGGYLLGYDAVKQSMQVTGLETLARMSPQQLGEEAVAQLSTMIGDKVILMAAGA